MANLMAHDDENMQNTEQEDIMIKNWKLPNSESVIGKGTPLRRIRIIIPISDAFANVKQQTEVAGTHWSLLTCDIQVQAASGNSVKAQFRHFDSARSSSRNFGSAQLVAGSLHKVGIV